MPAGDIISAELAAEDTMAYTPLRATGAREVRRSVVLTDQGIPYRFMRAASRLRLDAVDDLDAELASIRAWFAARDARPFTWFVGPSATPSDLGARLEALGARLDEEAAGMTALVLDHAPAAADGPEIREVTTFDDYVAQQELLLGITAASDEERAERRAAFRPLWEDVRSRGREFRGYLALIDGEPVSAGTLNLATTGHGILSGGATRPDARGKGCYAALVRHRWAVAQDLGIPALIVQASTQSRPVLERLGFRTVADVRVYVDEG